MRQEAAYLAVQSICREYNVSISRMCAIAGIARASYYKWLNREIPEAELLNEAIAEAVMSIHKEYPDKGHRRIRDDLLRDYGFDVSDRRTLDEVVCWLMEMGFVPSFCTACYREGRTGDRFMKLLKSRQIVNCCHPNALMTLKEYLEDYASPKTKEIGEALIQKELNVITNPKVKEKAAEYIANIHNGQRDFRF